MAKEKAAFTLHVEGKEPWSWTDIEPNWYVSQKQGKHHETNKTFNSKESASQN